MTYLVDTNVLSELRRKNPAPEVLDWFSQRPSASLHLSVLTIGEIRKGIEMLTDATRKAALHQWLSVGNPECQGFRLVACRNNCPVVVMTTFT